MIYAPWLYQNEPQEEEILLRKEDRERVGPDSLMIYHTCPACGGKAEWIRQKWAICYNCLIAFDAFELYYDLSEMDEPEDYKEE